MSESGVKVLSFRSVALRVGLAALLFVVANAAFGPFMDRARLRCVNRESGLINGGRKAAADVLVLGSSRAKYHYDPKLLSSLWGVSVYNAGFGGQGLPFTRVVLEQIAATYRPKAIVIDVMAFADDIDRVHACDPWYFDSKVLREMPGAADAATTARVEPDPKIACWMRLSTYRYAGKVALTLFDRPKQGEGPDFEALPVRYESDRWPPYDAAATPAPYPWLGVQLAALVDEARATGAEVVLTFSPSHGNTNNTAITGPAAAVAKAKGVPFLEFTTGDIPVLADKRYYDDRIHLNGDGARIFTREIAVRLRPLLPRTLGAKPGLAAPSPAGESRP